MPSYKLMVWQCPVHGAGVQVTIDYGKLFNAGFAVVDLPQPHLYTIHCPIDDAVMTLQSDNLVPTTSESQAATDLAVGNAPATDATPPVV